LLLAAFSRSAYQSIDYKTKQEKRRQRSDLIETYKILSGKATGNSRFETEKFPPLSEKFRKIPAVYQA